MTVPGCVLQNHVNMEKQTDDAFLTFSASCWGRKCFSSDFSHCAINLDSRARIASECKLSFCCESKALDVNSVDRTILTNIDGANERVNSEYTRSPCIHCE